jgi:hypothetical protein
MGPTCPLNEFLSSGFAIVDQNEMDGNPLIVSCTLHDQGNVIKLYALIDYGTTGYAFIDEDNIRSHHISLHLELPRNLNIIDGRIDGKPLTLRAITHILFTCLAIWNYQKDILLVVTKLW